VLKITLGAVEKLIGQDDVARRVFFLQRTDGTDADDPRNSQFFHRPDVRAMVQFTGQNAVTAGVAREEDDFAPGQGAGEQFIGGWTERRFDFHPFLIRETFDGIQAAAANDADLVF